MSDLFLRKKRKVISEINVTPFVDVLLVLLIIFMISAPLMTAGLDVNLPKAETPQTPENENKVTVSFHADGSIYLQEARADRAFLASELKTITKNNFDRKIYIMADKKLDYGSVMTVVSEITKAGFTKIMLITDPGNQ